MSITAIDCDVHPTVTDIRQLTPHLDEYWRDSVEERGIGSLESAAYPPNAPITARPDWRGNNGYAATSAADLAAQVLDKWGASHAILNCLYGVQLVYNEDMARAFHRALNDWIAQEWLDRDPRLRASIVVPTRVPEMAAEEIDRVGERPEFVQVLLPVRSEAPYGARRYLPIFEAAARHDLVVSLQFGGGPGNPPTGAG